MMLLAAVKVTPCDAACGCMTSTLGAASDWKRLKMSVRSFALTAPFMISLV